MGKNPVKSELLLYCIEDMSYSPEKEKIVNNILNI